MCIVTRNWNDRAEKPIHFSKSNCMFVYALVLCYSTLQLEKGNFIEHRKIFTICYAWSIPFDYDNYWNRS